MWKSCLLFVFLDSKFVPASLTLNMNYLLFKLFSYTMELQSIKWHYLHHPAIAVNQIESSVTWAEKMIFRQKLIISKNCNPAPRHPKFLRLAFLCTWVCVLNTLWMPSHLDIISFSPFWSWPSLILFGSAHHGIRLQKIRDIVGMSGYVAVKTDCE